MSMLVNEYINIQNELKELNNHINKFNYNSYFKQEFNRIIECSINNFNLKDVFKVLLYTFDYDFYILLTRNENYKKYYNLQELSNNEIKMLINIFIKHYCNFYEDNIKEIIKGSLTLKKYYVNDRRREVKYINFNNYSNEEIIKNLQNEENKYNYLYHMFDHIRFSITTSFIEYKDYAYIEDVKSEFDICGSSKSMDISDYILENTVYNYEKYIDKPIYDYYDFYYNLFWNDDKSDKILNIEQLNLMFEENIFYTSLLDKLK